MTFESYYSLEEREKSFVKFPKIKDAPLCNPKNFADAGFYSISTKKSKDAVKCFACGKELSNWEPGDDPLAEHERKAKECPYVKLKKSKIDGQNIKLTDFINFYYDVERFQTQTELDKELEMWQSEVSCFKSLVEK